jgi:hypothetical protein
MQTEDADLWPKQVEANLPNLHGWASPLARSSLLILQRWTAPRAVRADINMLKFVQPLLVIATPNCGR